MSVETFELTETHDRLHSDVAAHPLVGAEAHGS